MSRGKLGKGRSKIIIGLDPGLASIGWGAIKEIKNEKLKMKNDQRECSLVDYGCIRTSPKPSRAERLQLIYSEVSALIKKFSPDELAIEQIYFGKNAKTAMMVGEARGVITLAGVQAGLPILEFTPLQVKMAITSYGRADKNQVQKMVQSLLALRQVPRPDDAADALAVALTAFFTKDL